MTPFHSVLRRKHLFREESLLRIPIQKTIRGVSITIRGVYYSIEMEFAPRPAISNSNPCHIPMKHFFGRVVVIIFKDNNQSTEIRKGKFSL